MTEDDVKRIVMETIKELKRQELLQDAERAAYKAVSDRLYRYYEERYDADSELCGVLKGIESDKYYDIIVLFYCDGYTVEAIAEKLSVDVRTVTRNKKRICIDIYNQLQM